MPNIPVVENPRKRRRRRYTAKQRAYGFGGGRRSTRRRRRRNPGLAALTNPRRRRRYYSRPHRRRTYRRRNPGFGLGGVFKTFDLPAAGWTMGGMVATRALPGMVANWLPMLPTAGPMGLLTKAGTVAIMGMLAKKFVGARQAQHMVNGGLALIALDVWDQYIGPKIGMGMGGFVSTDELYKVTGMSGFVPSPPVVDGLGAGYEPALAA